MGWLSDLVTLLSDADRTSIHLLVESVEQMLRSLKRSAVGCFLKKKMEIWKVHVKCKDKRMIFGFKVYLEQEFDVLGNMLVCFLADR